MGRHTRWALQRNGALTYRGAVLDLASAPICIYSVTLVSDRTHDVESREVYARFRAEARQRWMMHFLEVFNPNVDTGMSAADTLWFINDPIVRLLATLTQAEPCSFSRSSITVLKPLRNWCPMTRTW